MFEAASECFSLDARVSISLGELAECCGLTVMELNELVDYQVLTPLDVAAHERVFSADWVSPLRTAARLRQDFDLDLFTLAMVLEPLQRIAQLERQVQSLQARMPTYTRGVHRE